MLQQSNDAQPQGRVVESVDSVVARFRAMARKIALVQQMRRPAKKGKADPSNPLHQIRTGEIAYRDSMGGRYKMNALYRLNDEVWLHDEKRGVNFTLTSARLVHLATNGQTDGVVLHSETKTVSVSRDSLKIFLTAVGLIKK